LADLKRVYVAIDEQTVVGGTIIKSLPILKEQIEKS